ncbi:DUF3516 domain-containing protein [Brevibacterium sp. 5221]|uniref:DUF3516 domain-containing protein n=1 Tax=Brevibacterium rongguiense TaxID=2695267 RepID=A0A6N9H535_9MICO|nr:DEAD/DEAH box helicase [Brevibacterium rongguiense]MYM19177.1 DUF3516 domain-containing protein [Brevibacterium rongguiense]
MPRLPHIPEEFADPDTLLEAFEDYCAELGIELYPAQQEAIYALLAGDNTIVATPTGSGKSMVALAALFAALSQGRRAFYTAPIKALVSEKFFQLVDAFGPESVGMVTGDTAVNPGAPVVCATAEVLANQALREGPLLDVGLVVMDEFHYFGDPQRGWAWQTPLLTLPQAQFALMSATLGDTSRIEAELTALTGRDTSVVAGAERPVPLEYDYSEDPLQETLQRLVRAGQAPIYVVSFSQRAAVELAGSLTSAELADRAQRDAVAEAIRGFGFAKGFGQILRRLLLHGIGVHHAGMLPKYRRLVEHLAADGLLSVISGTDTLGVGINVPIRTVLFTALTKYDGRRVRKLRVREFQQIAGRAGRAGFDTRGYVVAQAPEHVIDNAKALAKAGEDPKKRRKVKRKQPPAGFVSWSRETFDNLASGTPEELTSHMRISHSTIVNLLSRPNATYRTVDAFIAATHETANAKLDMRLRALGIGRSLLAAGVIEPTTTSAGEPGLRPVGDLGPQFALNQPLSPFALAALELFDPADESWALDVLSVIEATVPAPPAVLMGQLDRIKREELGALKAEGVEYEERMEVLDSLQRPQPNGEALESAFEAYVAHAPWLREIGLEPKAVVRDMIDQSMGFSQFVSYYGLARVEGGLLRYLTDVYRALVQTVPADLVTQPLRDIVDWLGEVIVRIDSSLVQEWEALRAAGAEAEALPMGAADTRLSADPARFARLVRNEMFHRVLLAERAAYDALGALDSDSGWNQKRWEATVEDYYAEYGELGIGPEARSSALFQLGPEEDGRMRVRQVLDDPRGDRDWAISAVVDVAASDAADELVLEIVDVGPVRP